MSLNRFQAASKDGKPFTPGVLQPGHAMTASSPAILRRGLFSESRHEVVANAQLVCHGERAAASSGAMQPEHHWPSAALRFGPAWRRVAAMHWRHWRGGETSKKRGTTQQTKTGLIAKEAWDELPT